MTLVAEEIKEFKSLKNAEDYYFKNLAAHNEDEVGLESWLEKALEDGEIILND